MFENKTSPNIATASIKRFDIVYQLTELINYGGNVQYQKSGDLLSGLVSVCHGLFDVIKLIHKRILDHDRCGFI